MYILNIGNSRSFLYREDNENKFVIELSNDHSPMNKDERYWLYEKGGLIE